MLYGYMYSYNNNTLNSREGIIISNSNSNESHLPPSVQSDNMSTLSSSTISAS